MKKWVVVRIDTSDPEHSVIYFYNADCEDDLLVAVLDDWDDPEDSMSQMIRDEIEDNWGTSVIFKEVE